MARTRKPKVKKTCATHGCRRTVLARELCTRHYFQDRRRARKKKVRAGDSMVVDDLNERCAVRGCTRLLLDEGLCVDHLVELLKNVRRKRGPLFGNTPAGQCALRGCPRQDQSRQVCLKHRKLLEKIAVDLGDKFGQPSDAIPFELCEVTIEELDLGDDTFAMRLDLGRIDRLAASIKRLGQLHNIIAWRRHPKKGLVVVSGRRRMEALKCAIATGSPPPRILARIAPSDTSLETLRVIASHENMQRDPISDYEMAVLARKLRKEGHDIPQIADQLGVTMSRVSRYFVLLERAVHELVEAFRRGQLSLGHARLIWGLDARMQRYWVRRALKGGLSVAMLSEALREADAKKSDQLVERAYAGEMQWFRLDSKRKKAPYPCAITAPNKKALRQLLKLIDSWPDE